jgi:Rps23 Pro-64 3,4-dihydroxylase Tpa1-like proline 4-hydroxylase
MVLKVESQPFIHLLGENFMDEPSFNMVIDQLDAILWQANNHPSFVQDNGILANMHMFYKTFCQEELIMKLNSFLNLSIRTCASIYFHRISSGGFNNMHTDANNFGEICRLIFYITDSYEGGELLLYNTTSKQISKTYKMKANSVFAFKMTEDAFHSVNKVISGIRINLIVTYK